MFRNILVALAVVGFGFAGVSFSADHASAGQQYFVKASKGPGPGSPAEAIALLEGVIIPSFDIMAKWEKDGVMVGGLPTGSRSFLMIIEAESNHDLDRMLRSLPLWAMLEWKVVPLESISGRAATERSTVEMLKKHAK